MNHADKSRVPEATSQEPGVVVPAPLRSLPAFSDAQAFHSDDVEHVANYRSLSVLALISLLIGLASPLCILSKGFLLLPLCGLVLSLVALRRIATSENRLAGRWAAVAGLVLCVACGATAVTRNYTVRYLRTSQAEAFARTWLAQVASNDLELAFKSTYDGARPPAPPEPGMPAPEKTPYDTFLSDPLIKKIAAVGKDATIDYGGTFEYTPLTQQYIIVRQRFLIAPTSHSEKSGATEPIEAYLTLQRSSFRGERNDRWLVMRYEPTNDPTN